MVEIESGETISNAALIFTQEKRGSRLPIVLVTSCIGSFRAYFRRSRAGDFESIEITTQYILDPSPEINEPRLQNLFTNESIAPTDGKLSITILHSGALFIGHNNGI